MPATHSTNSTNNIVESDVTENRIGGYGFRGSQYVTALIKLQKNGVAQSVCIDTGCTMSIIDRDFLLQQAPEVIIRHMASPITVRGVGHGIHACKEYIRLDIYLQGSLNALIHRDVYVVDGMKAKMLIGMDIIGSEKIILDIPQRSAIIGSCKNARIPINVILRSTQQITQSIKSSNNITIPPHTYMMIPIQQHELPNNRDLLFEPLSASDGLAIYAHIVDCHMAVVQARNDSGSPITLRQDTLLGTVVEYEVDGCYLAHPDATLLAGTGDISIDTHIIRDVFSTATATKIDEATNESPEKRLENGITIYGDNLAEYAAIVNSYPSIWKDDGGSMDVPEDQWMEIPLVENW